MRTAHFWILMLGRMGGWGARSLIERIENSGGGLANCAGIRGYGEHGRECWLRRLSRDGQDQKIVAARGSGPDALPMRASGAASSESVGVPNGGRDVMKDAQ